MGANETTLHPSNNTCFLWYEFSNFWPKFHGSLNIENDSVSGASMYYGKILVSSSCKKWFVLMLYCYTTVPGKGRVGIPLTCLTPPHYLCMCLSQVRSLLFSGCRLFMCYIFVFRSFFYIKRLLVFSFEFFYIVISGPFIAEYAVLALLIVEGHMVIYSC